jgi:hypothetical protein
MPADSAKTSNTKTEQAHRRAEAIGSRHDDKTADQRLIPVSQGPQDVGQAAFR